MKKLTYWVALCTNDSDRYSIRAKTKKEVVAILNSDAYSGKEGYDPPKKVTVEFKDSFDLVEQCLSEGSNYWEYQAVTPS